MYGSPVIEYLVAQRLAEARADAARRAQLLSLRAGREPAGARVVRFLRAAVPRMVAAARPGGRAVRVGRAPSV